MHNPNSAKTTYGAEDGVELLPSDLRRRILLEGGGEGGQRPHRPCLRGLNLHPTRLASDLPHLRSGHLEERRSKVCYKYLNRPLRRRRSAVHDDRGED